MDTLTLSNTKHGTTLNADSQAATLYCVGAVLESLGAGKDKDGNPTGLKDIHRPTLLKAVSAPNDKSILIAVRVTKSAILEMVAEAIAPIRGLVRVTLVSPQPGRKAKSVADLREMVKRGELTQATFDAVTEPESKSPYPRVTDILGRDK